MSVNPVSITSVTSPAVPNSVEKNAKQNKEKQPVMSKLSIRDGVLMAAIPTVLGSGYAAKTYFERRGKYSVYSDLIGKFAEGTAENSNFKDCAKLMKKGMRDAKVCGLLVAAAGVLAAGTFAIVKAFKNDSDKVDNKPKTISEKPKEIKQDAAAMQPVKNN